MKRLLRRVSLSSLSSARNSTSPPSNAPPPPPSRTKRTKQHTSGRGLEWNQEGYLLRHLGSTVLKEPYSNDEMIEAMRAVPKDNAICSVHLQLTNGMLTVTDLTGQVLIEVSVSLLVACIQDLKDVQDCMGIVLPATPEEHHLHMFQAMSCREAGVIVQHLGYAIRQEASAEGGGSSEEGGVTLQPRPPGASTPSHSSSGSGSTEKRPYMTTMPTAEVDSSPTKEVSSKKIVREKEEEISDAMKKTTAVSAKQPSAEVVRTYGQPSSEQVVSGSKEPRASRAAPPAPKEGVVTVRRVQSAGPVSHAASLRQSIVELSPRQQRHVSVKRVGSLSKGTTLSAEECIARVSRGAERIKDSNRKLVASCKKAVTGSSLQLDQALKAIFESDLGALGNLLASESLGVDSADEEGNTLLHYAVACQRDDIVKLLCERGAGVDAPGLNAVRPLHRAAVEGLVSILSTLLERGASPNELDSNLRSPLHFASAVEDFLESTYALLQRGARVYQKDALGVRPFDLKNPLKEMQGALVTSLCEAFSSTQLKDYEVVDVSSESLNSFSSPTGAQSVSQLFACSSRDRSLSSGSSSQDHPHTTPTMVQRDSSSLLSWQPQHQSASSLRHVTSGSLEPLSRYGSTGSLVGSIRSDSPSDLLSRYVKLAQSKAARFKSKISQMRQSQLRRSSSQLLEAEEDAEWRKEKLKFPSDFNINFAGVEMEMNAAAVEKQLNEFVKFSHMISQQKRKEKEKTLTQTKQQPTKLVLTEAEMEVQLGKQKRSPQTADTLTPAQQLSQDCELLSSTSSVEGEDSTCPPHRVLSSEKSAGVRNGSHTSSDTLVNRHGSSEASSVITHYTTSTQAMNRAFSDLEKAVDHDKYHTQIKAVAHCDSDEDIPRISIAKRYLHQAPRYVPAQKEDNRQRQETMAVFEEILADIQGDTAYEASLVVKEKSQRRQRNTPTDNKASTIPKHTLGPRVDLEPVQSSVTIRQRSSSALVTSVERDSSLGRSLSMHQRSMSFTSSGSSVGPLYQHHHRWASSLPYSMPSHEPGATALKGLIMLASNEECLSRLIQYVCLPAFSSRLVTLARSPRSSFGMLANIAILIQNIYEVGGSEGRKKAVESGILSITIKLLKARDPVPGTMLQLLYNLMFSEEDPTNYLRAIAKIPIVPLLTFLEPGGDRDSGFENRLHDTSFSTPPSGTLENRSRGSTGPQIQDFTSPAGNLAQRPMGSSEEGSASRPSSQVIDYHGNPVKLDRPSSREGVSSGVETYSSRTDSFRSDNVAVGTTDSGGSSRSLTTHTLHGQAMTFTEARRIALKLFAALSVYDKLHRELGTARAVGVLVDNLQDVSQENITNVVITLANLARNTETHNLMKHCSAVERLYPLLQQGPTIRHHVARALVYLGEIDTKGVSVFHRSNGYGAEEVCFLESEETQQVWGASLEQLVHYLIEDPALLWTTTEAKKKQAGPDVSRLTSPHPPSVREITWFFLVTMRSFVDPLIFLRLLLHRLAIDDPGEFSPQEPTSLRYASPPLFTVVGERVFSIIEQWMVDSIDNPTDDFVTQPLLQKEVAALVAVLNNARGPYSHHARNLKKLLDGLGRTRASSNASAISERLPHHDHLYPLCQKMIVEGLLPVTQEQAVTMAALQLHIQSLCGEQQQLKQTTYLGIRGSFMKRSSPTQQARRALPAVFHKVKNITKRVQEQRNKWARLSERNAKHLYIEKSQAIPGYGCQFFGVTLKSSQTGSGGGFFRKTQSEKRLLGISDKQMVLMDGRTKQILRQFSFKDILHTERHEESASVTIKLRDTQFTFLLEDRLAFKELVHILDGCEEYRSWRLLSEIGGRDDLEQFDPDWQAHFNQSMRENQYEGSLTPPISGDPSPSPTMANLDTYGDSLEKVLTPAAVGMHQTIEEEESGDGHVTMGHVTDVYGWQSELQAPWRQNYDYDSDEDSEEEVQFSCDCPPDPELGPDLHLNDINVLALLDHPLELARQITLIDHGLLCHVMSADILHKIRMSPKPVGIETHSSSQSIQSSTQSIEQVEGAIEKLAFRFNQLGNWVASNVLYYDIPEERAVVIEKFIIVAKHCFELRNYSAVMAIVVAGLGSPSVRRLKRSWEKVHEKHNDFLKKMNELMDSKGGYRKYRDMLANTSLPAVPYFGVFLRDLTQIVEYNPDYVRGGLINLAKRRLIYNKLQEVSTFRRQHYNYHCVPEIRHYLLHTPMEAEDELHDISHRKEPKQSRTAGSQASLRSSRGSFTSITSIPSGFLRRLRHGSITSVT